MTQQIRVFVAGASILKPEFNLQNAHKGRSKEATPISCPMPSTHTPCHMYPFTHYTSLISCAIYPSTHDDDDDNNDDILGTYWVYRKFKWVTSLKF